MNNLSRMDSLVNLKIVGDGSNVFQKKNILILEDSEHSFLVLGKDIVESIRTSSPDDEGVSDCNFSDQESGFSSVSHESELCVTPDENEKLKEKFVNSNIPMKEEREKFTAFQKKISSTLLEMSKNRDLLSSVRGSIDEIDRAIDNLEESLALEDSSSNASTTSSTRSRDSSLYDSNATLVSWKSAKMEKKWTKSAQCVNMHGTKSVTNCSETKDRSTEMQDCLLRTKDEKIVELTVMNKSLQKQVERLEDALAQAVNIQQDNCSQISILDEKISSYSENMRVLNDYFASTRVHYLEGHDIIQKCARIIQVTEKTLIGTRTLEESRKKLRGEKKTLKDKIKMLKAEIDRHEQSHKEENSMLEKEVFTLRKNCNELKEKLKEVKVENEALEVERQNSQEKLESAEELKKLLDDERKSHQEQHETLLSDTNRADLKNCIAKFIDTHKMVMQLQKQHDKMTELVSEMQFIDTNEVLNEKQKRQISRLSAIEKNHTEEWEYTFAIPDRTAKIELLTTENKILRNYVTRLLNSNKNA